MLIYNLERIYKARGIEKPFSFFKSKGFSDGYAAKLKHGKITGMKLSTLERVCDVLLCTPHDLLEWTPDKTNRISPEHPIRILERKNKLPDLTNVLETVSLDTLCKIEQLIDLESKKDDPAT